MYATMLHRALRSLCIVCVCVCGLACLLSPETSCSIGARCLCSTFRLRAQTTVPAMKASDGTLLDATKAMGLLHEAGYMTVGELEGE